MSGHSGEIAEAARQATSRISSGAQAPSGRSWRPGNEADVQKYKAKEVYAKCEQFYRTLFNYTPQLDEYKVEKKKYYARAQKELLRTALLTGDSAQAETTYKKMYNENPDQPEYLNAALAFFDKEGRRTRRTGS